MDDRERAAAVLRTLYELKLHGSWLDCARRSLDAGLLALGERSEEAIASYLDAARAWRELEVPFGLALSQLDFATLVGEKSPDARPAAEEARAIFERLDAKPFLARLDVL